MQNRRRLIHTLGLLLVVGLPAAGAWARQRSAEHCALDGGVLESSTQVRTVDSQGESLRFCCIQCAEVWRLRNPSAFRATYVTDEATLREVAAESAFFVRSSVVTNRLTGNRIHAFASETDARRHAGDFRGSMLLGVDRPLQDAAMERR